MTEKWEDPKQQEAAEEASSQSLYYGFCSAQPVGAPAWRTVKAESQQGACSCRQEDRAWGWSLLVTVKVPSAEKHMRNQRALDPQLLKGSESLPPSLFGWKQTTISLKG